MYYLVVNNLFLSFVIISTLHITGTICDEDIASTPEKHVKSTAEIHIESEEVEKKIAPIIKLLEKIRPSRPIIGNEKKGKIAGLVQGIARDAVKAELLSKRLNQIEFEKTQLEEHILILHIRSRIRELEKRYLKPNMLSWTRYDKWKKILRGDTRNLRMKNELQRFRNTIMIDVEDLIETIVNLYDEFSDCAAHNIYYPIQYDKTSIINLLMKLNITPDRSKVEAVEFILRPIP